MSLDAPLLRALFDSLGAGMYAVDRAGAFLACNPMVERLLGYSESELLGRDAHSLIHSVRPDGSKNPPADCPLLQVLRDGRPAQRHEDIFVRKDGTLLPVSWVSAPMRSDDQITGAVCVFSDVTERRELEQQRAEQLARERAARAESERAYARLALLSEVSQALTATRDVREGLTRLARLVVPELADWCVVDLFTEPDRVERVVVAHRDPSRIAAGKFEGLLPPLERDSRSELTRVLLGEGAILVTEMKTRQAPEDALVRAQQELFAELHADTAMVVPLRTRRQVLGAMTLVRTDPRRPMTRQDVVVADELGRRAGLLVDNARLYSEQRLLVETLQRGLLTQPPQAGDLRIAVRYLPANEAAEIGGDWYDAFVLPEGALALAIGDVVGHDVEAAVSMAQLRSILRGVAYQTREPPAAVLTYVDRIIQGLHVTELATAIFGRLEELASGGYQLTWSNAGHPAPLLLSADGAAELLEEGTGLVLGVGTDAEREDAVRRLLPGSTVVLYTDGLVENRSDQIDTGLARLRQAAASLVARPLDEFCDELIQRLVGSGATDDVALLAVRLPVAE